MSTKHSAERQGPGGGLIGRVEKARYGESGLTNLWHRKAPSGGFDSDFLGALTRAEASVLLDFYRETEGNTWTINHGWPFNKFLENPDQAHGLRTEEFTKSKVVGTKIKAFTKRFVSAISLPRNNLRITLGITPSFSGGIKFLQHLQTLDLSENLLRGDLLAWIGSCVCLQEVRLQKNAISGSIPENIGSLTDLRVLCLNDNELTGSIPPSIGKCTKLSVLQLQFNRLSGHFPAEMGQLGMLEEASFNCNHITGELPWTMGNLVFLRHLDIKNNAMTGDFPPEAFGRMRNLLSFEYSGNNFDVPEMLCMHLQDHWFQRIYNARTSTTKKIITFYRKILNLWEHHAIVLQCAYRCRTAHKRVDELIAQKISAMNAKEIAARSARIAVLASAFAIECVLNAMSEEEAALMRLELEKADKYHHTLKGRAEAAILNARRWMDEKRLITVEKLKYLGSADARAHLASGMKSTVYRLEPLANPKHVEALASIKRKGQIALALAGNKANSSAKYLQPIAVGAAKGSVKLFNNGVRKPIVNLVKDEMGIHNAGTVSLSTYTDGGQKKRDSFGKLRPPSAFAINARYKVIAKHTLE